MHNLKETITVNVGVATRAAATAATVKTFLKAYNHAIQNLYGHTPHTSDLPDGFEVQGVATLRYDHETGFFTLTPTNYGAREVYSPMFNGLFNPVRTVDPENMLMALVGLHLVYVAQEELHST